MSMIFCDSFDHYDTATMPQKWPSSGGLASSIGAYGRRAGSKGLRCDRGYVIRNIAAKTTLYVGFAFRVEKMPSAGNYCGMLRLSEATKNHMNLALTSSGTMQLWFRGYGLDLKGTTTVSLLLSAFNYIEFGVKIDDTTGWYDLRLNGTSVLSATNVDTRDLGDGNITSILLGDPISKESQMWYDDLYVNDSLGSVNNTFLGDVRVDCVMPDADGTYLDATPSTGTSHFALVDEIPPTTTDYNSLTATDQKDTYGFAALPSVGTTSIKGIQINSNVLKNDAGSRGISNVALSGGTLNYSANAALGTSANYVSSILETDPNTSAQWTESNVNAAEFGVRANA